MNKSIQSVVEEKVVKIMDSIPVDENLVIDLKAIDNVRKEIRLAFTDLLSKQREEVVEMIDKQQFMMSVEDYLPMVKAWNGKTFDEPFDHGYNQAKKDIKALIQSNN